MIAIVQYIQERFPPIPVFLFTSGYAALAMGTISFKNIWLQTPESSGKFFLLTCMIIFFLLRQRVIDEYRDAHHDQKNYPQRPVQRGLIQKKQLAILGVLSLLGEFICSWFIGWIGVYSIVFFYSLFMAKEFFISKWLNNHFTTYFFLHEAIFFLFGIYFITGIANQFPSFHLRTIGELGVLFFAPVSAEIIRKFTPRRNTNGKKVPDTYSVVWGRSNTLSALMILSIGIGLSLSLLKNSGYFLLFSFLIILCWIIVENKSDKYVTFFGVLNFLGFSLLSNIIW